MEVLKGGEIPFTDFNLWLWIFHPWFVGDLIIGGKPLGRRIGTPPSAGFSKCCGLAYGKSSPVEGRIDTPNRHLEGENKGPGGAIFRLPYITRARAGP
jgi:hypothetical protein